MSEQLATLPNAHYSSFLRQLPKDWEQKEVSQIGTVFGGSTPSREVLSFWGGTIPWLTPGEVSRGDVKFLHDTKEHISASGLAGSGTKLLPPGSLLVTTRATLGARVINAVPMTTNQGFKAVVFNNAQDANFYFHLFEKLKPELIRRASGTTFLEISGAEFGSIKVPSPPENEKLLIAKVLDNLDTTIHETEATIHKLKAIRQGLLNDLLTRGVGTSGELRPLQSEAPELYKESPLGWIPKDWTAIALEELAEHSPNSIVDGPFGSNLKTAHYRTEGIPVIQSGYVTSGRFLAKHYVYVTESHFHSQARSKVNPGDIVMAKIGANAGMCAVLPEDHSIGILAGNSLKITPDLRKVSREWLLHYLHRLYALTSMSEVRTETAQPAISLGRIRKLVVPVPTLTEQIQTVSTLEKIENAINANSDEHRSLQHLKLGLMDDLLTGRVRVTKLLGHAIQGST